MANSKGSKSDGSVVLEVSNLAKLYGDRHAVRNVSFAIHSGEIFGLLGPNGAGKTTTIGVVATIIRASRGEVYLSGESIDSLPVEAKRQIGLVPQRLCLYPSLTAEENLNFFGRMYGLEVGELTLRAEALLELVGLTARRGDAVETFSGGMKRRLNLACGLIHEPSLLLLDEPTVGVDPQSRERIFATVESLAQQGIAVLFTTHYMEEAERLCDRIAILDEGVVIAEGTVQELASLVVGRSSMIVTFENTPSPDLIALLRQKGAQQTGSEQFQMPGDRVEELIPELLRLTSLENNAIRELLVHRPNLGDVFLHLTGKELRD